MAKTPARRKIAPRNPENEIRGMKKKPPKSEGGAGRVMTKRKVPPRLPYDDTAKVNDSMPGDAEATPNGQYSTSMSLSKTRKYTKAQQKGLKVWSGESHNYERDALIVGLMNAARKKFGHSAVIAGNNLKKLVVGVPCPGLALEYLIRQSVWPLGVVIQFVAFFGVGKSSFAFDLIRHFYDLGGGGEIFEVETKINPTRLKAIVGEKAFPNVPVWRCDSIDGDRGWQTMLTESLLQWHKAMDGTKENPGPGRTFPVIFVVDSVSAKSTWAIQEKVIKERAASLTHAQPANINTTYFKTIPNLLDGWPFVLVLVNHLKKDIGDADMTHTPGGTQINFQESLEIEIRRTKSKILSSEWDGEELEFSCRKNALGDKIRRIRTRVLNWETPKPGGGFEPKTIFDWDWSTVHMLANLEGRFANYVRQTGFDLHIVSEAEVENSAWSKALGVSQKEPRPWHEIGAMIRERQDIMDVLRDALRIEPRPLLEGDCLKQLDAMKEELP